MPNAARLRLRFGRDPVGGPRRREPVHEVDVATPMAASRSRIIVAMISVAGQPEYVGVTRRAAAPNSTRRRARCPARRSRSPGLRGRARRERVPHHVERGVAAPVAAAAIARRSAVTITTARPGRRAAGTASRPAGGRGVRCARPACRRGVAAVHPSPPAARASPRRARRSTAASHGSRSARASAAMPAPTSATRPRRREHLAGVRPQRVDRRLHPRVRLLGAVAQADHPVRRCARRDRRPPSLPSPRSPRPARRSSASARAAAADARGRSRTGAPWSSRSRRWAARPAAHCEIAAVAQERELVLVAPRALHPAFDFARVG